MRKPLGKIIVFSVLVLASAATWADAISFEFALDQECATSAGVYAPDGQMVRTLWSQMRMPADKQSGASGDQKKVAEQKIEQLA